MRELWPDLVRDWVVYQDAWLLVVDKPAGVSAQAARPGDDDDLPSRVKRWLAAERGVDPGEVYLGVHQRLDRDTSGLVLFTLQPEANPGIARQFEQRTVDKTYVAAVEQGRLAGLAGPRVLEHQLAPRRQGRVEVVAAGEGGRAGRVRVVPGRRTGGRELLELHPQTGRTHQLRVQLAHEGSPIAGDAMYGRASALRLMLHATELRLRHPTEERALRFESVVPLEFEDWLRHGARDVLDDPRLLRRALQLALQRRYRLGRARADAATTAFRLFHEAGDGSRRLAVDVYAQYAVVHLFADEAELPADPVLDAVAELGFEGVYLKRHLKQKNELVDARDSPFAPTAAVRGLSAPDELVVREHGVPFGVRLGDGLRTGLFLDQRDNRLRVRELSAGKRVLNLFAYTGGFSVAALAGGAREAVCVDAAAAALQWGAHNVARIEASQRHRYLRADAFEALQRFSRRGERFDLIVLDPPSYSTTRSRRFVAARDYAELCQACLRVLGPGGQLLACINHHGTSRSKLRADVREAARALGHGLVQVKDLPTGADFPAAFGAEPSSKSVLATCE